MGKRNINTDIATTQNVTKQNNAILRLDLKLQLAQSRTHLRL